MANSKHVEEILEQFRSAKETFCSKQGEEIKIIGIDTYPEETNNIILLDNGKRITTDDLEFAEAIIGEQDTKVVLGDYIFHLDSYLRREE
jgi:hypothetical protein